MNNSLIDGCITKKCTKCGEEKELIHFSKKSDTADGLRNICKKCQKYYAKKYYIKNKGKINNCKKIFLVKNPGYNRDYYRRNVEKLRASSKKWHSENLCYFRDYYKNRKKSDIEYRISSNLRSRIRAAISNQYGCKAYKTTDLIGCSISECRKMIGNKFEYAMSWENYGEWHIDHIRPLSSFDLTCPEQQKIAFHYTNLQPLWADDNRMKSNKLDWVKDANSRHSL